MSADEVMDAYPEPEEVEVPAAAPDAGAPQDWEGDLATDHPNRCRLRDNLLYADIFSDDGSHRPVWRCHKRAGHDGPCSSHNDCGVMNGSVVCGWLPGHAGPHAWATEIVVSAPEQLAPAAHQETPEPTMARAEILEIANDRLTAAVHDVRVRKEFWDADAYRVHVQNNPEWQLSEFDVQFYGAVVRELGAPARAAEWQPIETAPKDGSPVLTRALNGARRWCDPSVLYYIGGIWRTSPERDPLLVVYHQPVVWMPLPLPPVPSRAQRKNRE